MKIGVVGHGSIGHRHATNLRKMGHEVVIYDPQYSAGLRFERHIYETCPAVVIATPTKVHWSCIRAAAERGCHMLIEKPIASGDLRGLQMSLDLAASKGAVVMMGNNLRFHPCVIEAKTHLLAEAGQPLWASFTCAAKSVKPLYLSDGVIMCTGAHEVDLALHLLGPAKVVTSTARLTAGHDDIADFVLEHENGCRSSFHLDFVTEPEIRSFRIVGKNGDIFCELPARFIRGRFLAKSNPAKRASSVQRTQLYGKGSYDDDYIAEMEDFVFQCAGGPQRDRAASGADGVETLKLLLDIRKMAGLS